MIGALDRFAQFFVAPLCLENTMDREVMAVDSEFFLDLQEDHKRMTGLMEDTVFQTIASLSSFFRLRLKKEAHSITSYLGIGNH